jgi:hypothetical protein
MKQRYTVLIISLGLLVWLAYWALKRALLTAPVERRQRARLADLKTGDLLLWSHKGKAFMDFGIVMTGCEFTHVGILFVDAKGKPFVWEIRGFQKPRLNPLLKRLGEPTSCIVRHLHSSVPVDLWKFEQCIHQFKNFTYSVEFWRSIVATWNMPMPTLKPNRGSVFCSELVALTYAALGVLFLDDYPAADTLVSHFSQQYQRLALTSGHAFGPELQLTD